MNILFTHLYDSSSGLGGADRGVLELASAIKNRYGANMMVIANEGELLKELSARGVLVTAIPSSKVFTVQTLFILHKVIHHFHPDVIHSHHRYTTFLLDNFFKKKTRILHTERVIHRNKQWVYRYGHFVTTVSDGVRNNLIQSFHVPPECVLTIPNAVEPHLPDEEKIKQIHHDFRKANDEIFGLCTGRLHEQKGHVYLIEAVALLPENIRRKLKIFLGGDGPLHASLQKLVRDKNLEKNIIFLGYTSSIYEWLTVCDFLILPSLWEGLPRSVLEAMNMSKAVIATDIAGTNEAVIADFNGLLVPAKDSSALSKAILRFLTDPSLREKLLRGARETAEKFSFDKMTLRYFELYSKLRDSDRRPI